MNRIYFVLFLLAVTGCNNPSTPGGPGATNQSAKQPLYGEADNTFNLGVPSSVPYMSTNLKQGGTATVTISVKRGKNFDEDVTLKFDSLPTGVTLDPQSPVIKRSETEAKLTVKAADDAALGDFTIKVKGHPTKGEAASSEFKVTVEKQETFTLSGPSVTIKQGETKALPISVKRDKNFNEEVTVKVTDVPKGLTLDPASPVVSKTGDKEAQFTLKAADDAALGDFIIKVNGHPTKGADATSEVKVTVTKK
jgi:uncharacterized membrane protein